MKLKEHFWNAIFMEGMRMATCIRCDEEIVGEPHKTDDGDLCEDCYEKLAELCDDDSYEEGENLIIGDIEYERRRR